MIRIAPPWFAWIMRKLHFGGWTSLWGVAYLLPECEHDQGLIRHELKHLEQMERDGKFMFMVKYLYWLLKYGYLKNPYEVEARLAQNDYRSNGA